MRSAFFWFLSFGGFAAVSLVCGLLVWPQLVAAWPSIEEKIDQFRRLPPLAKLALLLFVGAFVVYGSTKTNQVDQTSGTNEVGQIKVEATPSSLEGKRNLPFRTSGEGAASTLTSGEGAPRIAPASQLASLGGYASTLCAASTLEWQPVGGSVVRAEALYRCGATEDALRLAFGGGFVFPDGTNHLDRVVILSSGEVRRTLQDRDALVRFGERLWSRPYDSELTAEHTPSNTCRLVWRNFYANGDTNLPRTVSAELFRNGDLAVTENGLTAIAPYVIPFPHDGFGQDDEWVRANCTNAAEVLSVGYPQWVDDQVGVGLENGLYKFTATFPDDPPEATRLFVGDRSVCVTNAGEYVFLLEKGVEYEFGTVPYDGSVEYSMQDDVAPSAPVFAAWWWGGDVRGEWTVDGGWRVLDLPTIRGFGVVMWEPTFRGSPDLLNHTVTEFPMTFTALLDSCRTNGATYRWSSSDERVNILSPSAQTTEVEIDSSMSGGDLELSVEAYTQGRNYYSTLWYHFATNSGPAFSLSMPDTLFVNNDDDNDDGAIDCSLRFTSGIANRDDDVASAKVTLPSGESRRGTLELYDRDGFIGTFFDATVKGDYVGQGSEWEMSDSSPDALSLEASGSLPSDGYRSSQVKFRWTPDSGDEQTLSHRFTVVEPVVAPICSERKPVVRDGVEHRLVYNPSGVVVGKDAYFKISVTPDDYPDSKIRWHAVGEGSVEFVGGDTGREVCVRGVTEGDVTLEISIGDSPSSKPTFSVTVVENVSVKMDVCILSGGGHLMREEPEVRSMLAEVNDIYEQVGITFYIDSIVVTNISHACFPVYDGLASEDHWSFDDVAHILPNAGGLKCYFIDSFVDSDDTIAANDTNGMLLTRDASGITWAHEIGHSCGLKDIYVLRNGSEVPVSETFEWRHAPDDWNNGSYGARTKGSRYYRHNLTHREAITNLLMYGYSVTTGLDITTGSVDGIVKISRTISEKGSAKTGMFAAGVTRTPIHKRKETNDE